MDERNIHHLSDIGPMTWSIRREGSEHPASPTTRAGTPATVVFGGTGFSTTEPAAMREQLPISILSREFLPLPDHHAISNLGMAVRPFLAGATSVTPCKMETLSPMTAVSPTTRPVA